jgi:hypothetical protein
MKNNMNRLFALIGLSFLGLIMGIANATQTSTDCGDDDAQPIDTNRVSTTVIKKEI